MVLHPGAKAADFRQDMLILVDKPLDWTSFDVVNKVRYALKNIFPGSK